MKLFCDECIGEPVFRAVENTLRTAGVSVQFKHIKDFQLQGVADEIWVPRIAAEGWVVLSADRARKGARGGKLPYLLARYNVTRILMASSIHHLSSMEKASALMAAWPTIAKNVFTAPKGSRFSIRRSTSLSIQCVQVDVRGQVI